MKTSRTLYLLLKSKFLLLACCAVLSACSGTRSASKDLPQPYAAVAGQGLVYNAAFYYKDFNASGLLVIKRLAASEYHLVLLSKFGVGLMEFKLRPDGIQWIKTFEQLQDKKVEKMLERDFRMLLLTALENPDKVEMLGEKKGALVYQVKGDTRIRIRVTPEKGQVIYAENRGFLNPVKTKVAFYYGEQQVPDSMALRHRNINMGLDLNLLKITHAEK